jgi:hypothetical protein
MQGCCLADFKTLRRNRVFGPQPLWADWLGIQVELVGWEDIFKRFGRPQEQINLDLDRCEAFIGMLWRKWGTPPHKDGGGPFTSGFEEEFERALTNRKKGGRPGGSVPFIGHHGERCRQRYRFTDVRDANILFTDRAGLALSRREIRSLMNSGLDNIESAIVPFWHWYVAADASEKGQLSIASIIGPQSRRVGALKAMRLIGEPIKPLSPINDDDPHLNREYFLRSYLALHRDDAVNVAALEYLAVCGNAEDLPALKAEFDKRRYQTVAAAADAIVRINLRQGRERAVQSILELQPDSLTNSLVDAIFNKPDALPTGLLLDGVASRHPRVRSAIVTILVARNALLNDVAETLLGSAHPV